MEYSINEFNHCRIGPAFGRKCLLWTERARMLGCASVLVTACCLLHKLAASGSSCSQSPHVSRSETLFHWVLLVQGFWWGRDETVSLGFHYQKNAGSTGLWKPQLACQLIPEWVRWERREERRRKKREKRERKEKATMRSDMVDRITSATSTSVTRSNTK